jgi:hypothetical protein
VQGVGVVSDTSDGDFTTNQGGFGGPFNYYAEFYNCGFFSSTPPDDVFTTPPVEAWITSSINYNWGDTGPCEPPSPIQCDYFAARWRGIFYFDEGSCTFTATVDDGVRVYLDGELIIDQWRPQVATTYEVTKGVSEGDHQVKIEYFERMGVAICNVSWLPELYWIDSNGIAWSSPRRVTSDANIDDRPSIVEFATYGLLGKYVFWHSWRPVSVPDQFYPDQWQNLSLDPSGASWSDASLLTAEGYNYRPAPAIINGQATWPSGERSLWVVWSSNRPGSVGYDIYYKYLYQSSLYVWEWSSDLKLNPAGWDFSGVDQDPSITETSNGYIWIAWSSDVDGDHEIYMTYSMDSGDTWQDPFKITANTNDDMYPSITRTIDNSDREYIWIVWHSNEDGDDEIYCTEFDPISYLWVSANQLTHNTVPDRHPTVMQTQYGEIWIAWDEWTTTNGFEVYYTLAGDCCTVWSGPVDITNDSHVDQTPWLTQTFDGRVWVVWATDRCGDLEIYAMYGIP